MHFVICNVYQQPEWQGQGTSNCEPYKGYKQVFYGSNGLLGKFNNHLIYLKKAPTANMPFC